MALSRSAAAGGDSGGSGVGGSGSGGSGSGGSGSGGSGGSGAAAAVPQRSLGPLDVSVLALGCWPFAGGASWGEQADSDSVAAVHAALAAGITLFDTAEGYGEAGRSERVLGQALRGRRDRALIATKVRPGNDHPDTLADACAGSLQRLQTDYVDLYQIHWPNRDVPFADSIAVLERLQEQGKIRAWSVCNFGVGDMTELLAVAPLIANQLPYSMLWRPIESAIQPLCAQHGVGIVCYSGLAQGLLTGRYAAVDDVPEHLMRSRWYAARRVDADHGEAGCEAQLFAALATLRNVAGRLGQHMATVALAWLLHRPQVATVLVGARNAHEVELNLPAAQLALDAEVQRELDHATEPVRAALGDNPDMWMAPGRFR